MRDDPKYSNKSINSTLIIAVGKKMVLVRQCPQNRQLSRKSPVFFAKRCKEWIQQHLLHQRKSKSHNYRPHQGREKLDRSGHGDVISRNTLFRPKFR